ncbi:hypothetical protein UlMin_040676 [Ulmus minor]
MQYFFDKNGRRYLDAFAGIVTVSCGCCHPDILNAIRDMEINIQFSLMLCFYFMDHKIQVVFFVNYRNEANELAMLMARLYTGNFGMISLRNAYHGGKIHHVVNPDPYREVFGSNANLYAEDVEDHIDYGIGGTIELTSGYLKLVYDIVHKVGGVCIADEVQTGFGRTGSHYWGSLILLSWQRFELARIFYTSILTYVAFSMIFLLQNILFSSFFTRLSLACSFLGHIKKRGKEYVLERPSWLFGWPNSLFRCLPSRFIINYIQYSYKRLIHPRIPN